MFLAASIIPIALGILAYVFNKQHKKLVYISYFLTIIILLISNENSVIPGGWNFLTGIEFVFDNEVRLILVSFLVFSFINYIRINKLYNHDFSMMWLILNGSINSFFMSRDFFNIYVHYEVISMVLFLLMAIDRNSKRIWASLKYMIMSAIALDFYLIGIAFVYSNTGSLNITYTNQETFPIFASTFLIVGLLIKSGIIFVAGWLPDAHGNAARGFSPILSGVLVKMGLYVIYLISPSIDERIITFIIYFSIFSSILGSFFTIIQNDIKKMLAYSTMTQMSYGLLIIFLSPNLFIFFIIYHMFSKGFIFGIAEDIYYEKRTQNLKELKGTYISIGQYILLTILLFNMSGIFPSNMYIFKKEMGMPLLFDLSLMFFGMYFIKILSTFKIHTNIQLRYLYVVLFLGVSFFIAVNYVKIEYINIILQYVIFIFGILFYKKYYYKRDTYFEIHRFHPSVIFQLVLILVMMLIEIF